MQIHKHKVILVIALVLLLLAIPVTGYLIQQNSKVAVYSAENVSAPVPDVVLPKTVTVAEAENSRTVTTYTTTIKDLLNEMQIALGLEDKVEPGLNEPLVDNIKITRIQTKKITQEQAIAFSIEQKADSELYQGEKRILQKGKKGLEKAIYEIVLENGQEISKNLLEKIIVRESITQVVAVGSRQTTSRGGQNIEFDRVITMSASGYTSTGQKTYSGNWPSIGVVAVDPAVIPLGTRLYIDGYGYATALDIGGDIKGNRLDLFFESRAEALKWGRRSVKVFVIK